MSKRKAMISQPMFDRTEQQILADRDRAIKFLEEKGYEVVDSYFDPVRYDRDRLRNELGILNTSLYFLAKSLELMSTCYAAYFVKGWDKARGCLIEHAAAMEYGLELIYEE